MVRSILGFRDRVWTASGTGLVLDASPDSYQRWESSGGQQLDAHRTGWVRLVGAPDPGAGEVVVKCHLYPSSRDRRRGLFRNTVLAPSRARREAENLIQLARRGLNPDLLVAFGERRRLGVLHACLLVTRYWPSVDLSRWFGGDPDARNRRETLRRLGRFAARLHAAGYVDRDLHLRNLLRADDGTLAKIDCSRGRFGRPFARACRRDAEDLARDLEHLGARERRLVLGAYLRETRLSPKGESPTARSSARRAASSCRTRRSPAPG